MINTNNGSAVIAIGLSILISRFTEHNVANIILSNVRYVSFGDGSCRDETLKVSKQIQ